MTSQPEGFGYFLGRPRGRFTDDPSSGGVVVVLGTFELESSFVGLPRFLLPGVLDVARTRLAGCFERRPHSPFLISSVST